MFDPTWVRWHHVVVRWRIKAHSSIHPVPIMMWMMMLIHVRVWDLWLWIVNGMVVVFGARSILMMSIVLVMRSQVIISMLRFSIVHVRVVMMIGIGSFIDGVVVVVPIVAHWFIFHITVQANGRVAHMRAANRSNKWKWKLTECCGAHEGPPGQPWYPIFGLTKRKGRF